MKERTLADVHSKEIGHKKFAKFVDMALNDNHTITNIKEYYEKFKFVIDGVEMEYSKDVKDNKGYYEFTIKTLNAVKRTMKFLRGI